MLVLCFPTLLMMRCLWAILSPVLAQELPTFMALITTPWVGEQLVSSCSSHKICKGDGETRMLIYIGADPSNWDRIDALFPTELTNYTIHEQMSSSSPFSIVEYQGGSAEGW